MKSFQGHLLVASPRLTDPNFFRAVVLMVQHGESGALGLVLNKPLNATVQKVWSQISEGPCLIEDFLHQGGPCEGPLMVLHTEEGASELEVLPGLHFSTSRGVIEQLVEAGESPTKFFHGYSGWAPGQLEHEIETASWLTMGASIESVFEPPPDLWSILHKTISRASQSEWVKPLIMPDDPSMN